MAEFFKKPFGKGVAFAVLVVGVGAAAYAVYASMGGSSAATALSKQVYMDAKTGRQFDHTLEKGEVVPITAPSGGKTGYPAELCYWTADGKPKDTPSYVLLKAATGDDSPTFCPDCHRLVVHHNPAASPGSKPPPTQTEYEAR